MPRCVRRHHTCVKNTFIDFPDDRADDFTRKERSSSLPPSARICTSSQSVQYKSTDSPWRPSKYLEDNMLEKQNLSDGGKWLKMGTGSIFVPPMPMASPPSVPDGDFLGKPSQTLRQGPLFSEDMSTDASEKDKSSEVGDSPTMDDGLAEQEAPIEGTSGHSAQEQKDVSNEASEEDMFSEAGTSSTMSETSVNTQTPVSDTASASPLAASWDFGYIGSCIDEVPFSEPKSNCQRANHTSSRRTRGCAETRARRSKEQVESKFQLPHGYQIAEVLLTIKSMLVPYFQTSMEVCQQTSCWLIKIQIPSKHMAWKEAIDLAKDTFVQACEETKDVELLASSTDPFITIPNGFVATLALVPDKQQACGELLQTGFCHYGNYCHWQHPVHLRQVYVELVFPNQR